MNTQWQFRLSPDVLNASFNLPNGETKRGRLFIVQFRNVTANPNKIIGVPVRAVSSENLAPHLRKNMDYHADSVLNYIKGQLENGWNPNIEKDHLIYIDNPPFN